MNVLGSDISVGEKLVRPAVVYGFLLIASRRCGKRQLGQRGGTSAASARTRGTSGPPCVTTGWSRSSTTPSSRGTGT